MAKPIITNYSVEEMESMLMSNPDYQIGMRLMACIQIAKGTSSRKLQEFYYKSHSRYLVWANRFNAAGIEGLKNLPGRGRKPKLSNEDLKAIRQIVLKESPGEYGYNTETWTGPLLIDFIKKEFAVEYKKAADPLLRWFFMVLETFAAYFLSFFRICNLICILNYIFIYL